MTIEYGFRDKCAHCNGVGGYLSCVPSFDNRVTSNFVPEVGQFVITAANVMAMVGLTQFKHLN